LFTRGGPEGVLGNLPEGGKLGWVYTFGTDHHLTGKRTRRSAQRKRRTDKEQKDVHSPVPKGWRDEIKRRGGGR
jgi:hypothetical protein